MVVWKERKHEYDDSRAGADAGSIAALQGYGILNAFHVPRLKYHVILLEYILRM